MMSNAWKETSAVNKMWTSCDGGKSKTCKVLKMEVAC